MVGILSRNIEWSGTIAFDITVANKHCIHTNNFEFSRREILANGMRQAIDNISPMMLKLEIITENQVWMSSLHESSNRSYVALDMQLLS